MKKIGDAMKHVLPRMPNDIMEVPLYFETVENAFRSFEVDRRYWVKLLLPLMTQRARTVINRVALADRDNDATVKEQLLKEFKLTPREYRSKFMYAKKTAEETYTMFTARLKNLLNYYVKSRQVNDDYERLFDLFISDKLKETLPPGPLQFVLSKEGTECFKASMIADLADIHTNNKIGMPIYSKQSYGSTVSDKINSSGNGFRFPDKKYQGSSNYGQNRWSQSERNSPVRQSNENQDQKQVGWRTPQNRRVTEASTPKGFGSGYPRANDDVRRCHHCNSGQHLVRDCDKARRNQGTQEKRADFRVMKVNSIHLLPPKENLDVQEINQTLKVNSVKSNPIWLDCYGNQYDPDNPTAHRDSTQNARVNHIQVRPKEDNNALKKVQLEHVIVEIQGKETDQGSSVKVNALSDSGAEIPVISEELIEGMNLEQVGEVSLQCVAGEPITAKLVEVKVRICESPSDTDKETRTNQVKFTITPYAILVCACIAGMGSKEKFLLHPKIIAELKMIPRVIINREKVQANAITRAQRVQKERDEAKARDEEEREDEGKNEKEKESDETSDEKSSITSDRIRQENDACESDNLLKFEDSDEDMWDNGLPIASLFEEAEEDGEQVMQEAIRKDRVLITSIPREDTAFRHMTMDVVGPTEPTSAAGHKYCLCIVDSCTRWPAVYLLKSLTAKAVCEELKKLFMDVGVPSVITSDQGTNFTSSLTKEFLKMFGVTPRFNIPGHPESSGIVERWNQTFKKIIHHVIIDNPRQWHKIIPFTVWAIREVPNATTGVAPYMLVYGRLPRGPSAVLKESWTGDINLPSRLGLQPKKYLQKMKE